MSHSPWQSPLDRRAFFRRAGLTSAFLTGVTSVFGQQPRKPPFVPMARPAGMVRVRGRVHAGAAGIAKVAVTDGVSVVQTDARGEFSLVAAPRQPFVYISVPRTHVIPQNPTGTARFYQPIVASADGEATAEFALVPRRASSDEHAFLALPDVQAQDATDMAMFHAQTVPDVAQWARAQGERPLFGVAVGDIMFDDLALYPEYERGVTQMALPFFQVVGNHDLDFEARAAELTTSTFMRHFGPTYYSFDVGAVHYIVLQDVHYHGTGYVGYVDERQLQWLEADLALVEAGRRVVVFTHIPLESKQWARDKKERRASPSVSVNNRAAVYAMLSRHKVDVISGHTHENEHVFEGGVHEHVQGTVCGAWWTGPICHDGTPAGYGIYEVRGETIQWTYKGTGQPLDHQLRVYGPGSDPDANDELIANVWNWDPQWTVEWIADGVARGPMARRTGFDPLSVQLHKGDDLPKRRTWVEPHLTSHLFYAPAGASTREVQVRATDRFGRTFTAEWRRPSA